MGQNVWCIHPIKTFAYDCLCTLKLCTTSINANSNLWHLGDFLPSACSSGSRKSLLFCCLHLHLVGHSKLLLFQLIKSVGQPMFCNVLLYVLLHCFLSLLRSWSKSPIALAVLNQFRYLNTSKVALELIFVHGWWDQSSGFTRVNCGFWFQESSLLLFSVRFIFYQWLVLNVGTMHNCTVYSRCGRIGDLYSGRISSMFLYRKLLVMNPSTLLAVSQLVSSCLFLPLEVWWWWLLDPSVDLLLSTVDWTCHSCLDYCCVRIASQNIVNIEIVVKSFVDI